MQKNFVQCLNTHTSANFSLFAAAESQSLQQQHATAVAFNFFYITHSCAVFYAPADRLESAWLSVKIATNQQTIAKNRVNTEMIEIELKRIEQR